MGRLILVEGLDLAGKSTLIKRLQSHYQKAGWKVTVSHGDLCPENPVAKVTRDMMRWDPDFTPAEGGPLFLASHLWDLRNFRRPTAENEVHIQDSCALRSLAFEKVVGRPHFVDLFQDVVNRLPRFDAAFVLTASLSTRRRRYQTRELNDLHDQFMFKDPVSFSRIDSELLHLAVKHTGARLVETDEMNADEVLNTVLHSIENRWLLSA